MRQVTRANDPAPSRWAYRYQRWMLTPVFRVLIKGGLSFGLTFLVASSYLSNEGRQEAIRTAIADVRHQIETRPEFTVQLLAVEGASEVVETEIRETLPIIFPASSFDIDLAEMRGLIIDLPAVADAHVHIRRGGVMTVEVIERVPVVVWRTRDRLSLLDRDGFVVEELASRSDRATLPMIAGKGANEDVSGALEVLAAAAPLNGRLRGLLRIGERRWDVVLDRGQHIQLPETHAVQALERVIVLDQLRDLLVRDVVIVDMRLADRPTIRMNAHAAEEWWRVTGLTAGSDN